MSISDPVTRCSSNGITATARQRLRKYFFNSSMPIFGESGRAEMTTTTAFRTKSACPCCDSQSSVAAALRVDVHGDHPLAAHRRERRADCHRGGGFPDAALQRQHGDSVVALGGPAHSGHQRRDLDLFWRLPDVDLAAAQLEDSATPSA